jgi:hypothetical protein
MPFDEFLLDRVRTQWQFGAWDELIRLRREEIERHPERARLALYAAAGRSQVGDAKLAAEFLRLAKDWGCNRRLVGEVMVGGAHNTMARAYALAGAPQRAHAHYESALRVGGVRSEVKMLAAARAQSQSDQLGLTAGVQGALQRLSSSLRASASHVGAARLPDGSANPRMADDKALKFYRDLAAPGDEAAGRVPFLLLDSKSIPRSGLHYLQRSLSSIFQEDYSFCEWYQEAGCCRRQPCALTGFAEGCRKGSTPHVRLLKSHDFELRDPRYPLGANIHRPILVRDPLYVLTSWFALDQLTRHAPALKAHGVEMSKIWLSHEPAVLAMAWDLLDKHFMTPSGAETQAWLEEKSAYLRGFAGKWLPTPVQPLMPFETVVRYEDTPTYLATLVETMADGVAPDLAARWRERCAEVARRFAPRSEAFASRSQLVAEVLERERSRFEDAAEGLRTMLARESIT